VYLVVVTASSLTSEIMYARRKCRFNDE